MIDFVKKSRGPATAAFFFPERHLLIEYHLGKKGTWGHFKVGEN